MKFIGNSCVIESKSDWIDDVFVSSRKTFCQSWNKYIFYIQHRNRNKSIGLEVRIEFGEKTLKPILDFYRILQSILNSWIIANLSIISIKTKSLPICCLYSRLTAVYQQPNGSHLRINFSWKYRQICNKNQWLKNWQLFISITCKFILGFSIWHLWSIYWQIEHK